MTTIMPKLDNSHSIAACVLAGREHSHQAHMVVKVAQINTFTAQHQSPFLLKAPLVMALVLGILS